MDNRTNNDRADGDWVDQRLAALGLSERLTPDATGAYAKLRQRERRRVVMRNVWIGGTATAAVVAAAVVLALPQRAVCCTRPASTPPTTTAPVSVRVVPPAPAPSLIRKPSAVPAVQTQVHNYKESGSPEAPIVCEIYADFECPACAVFYRDTYPRIVSEYVNTGKARIVHRDFPLPRHVFAKQAARYANAAGEVGEYGVVFDRLFETQAEWEANGNIEAALATAVKPRLLATIREKLMRAADLDDSIAADVRMGAEVDRIDRTPTLVVVTPDGRRHKLAGAVSFEVLSAYLNELEGQ
jgi:protein-disulfide isomerase